MSDELLEQRVWRAARDHVEACEEANDALGMQTPASAPFCGCDTCVMREAIVGAWPVLEEGLRRELDHDNRRAFWIGFAGGACWGTFWFLVGALIYLVAH